MTEDFIRGLIALPALVLALALVVIAVLGAWLLIEKWWILRWQKLEPVRWPEELGAEFKFWSAGDLGRRGGLASLILTSGKGRVLKVGPAALIFTWGKADVQRARKLNAAMLNALQAEAKKEASE